MTSNKPDINQWLTDKKLTYRNSDLSSKSYNYLNDVLRVKGTAIPVPQISEQAKNVAEIIDIYNTLLNEYNRDYGKMPTSSTILNGEVLFYPPDKQETLSEVLDEFSKGFEAVNFAKVTLTYNNHVESLQRLLPTKEDKSEYTMNELLYGLRATYRKNASEIENAFKLPHKENIPLNFPPPLRPDIPTYTPPLEAQVVVPQSSSLGGKSRRRKRRKSRRRKSRKRKSTKKYK
jgi:hypothetical protein